MTVCIASLFVWNYGTRENPDWGFAGLSASDRMITAGDIQYEPSMLKAAMIGQRAMIMIAGDYTLHSQAIRAVKLRATAPAIQPLDIARMYRQAIQSIRQKQAEDIYLAPLGLNAETFLAQQREMSSEFIAAISNQMQSRVGDADVEALIVGSNGENVEIHHVDNKGSVRSYFDVGFAAIGIGGYHARSSLMQARYVNTSSLHESLALTYAAKRRSEVAPGVGEGTDMHLVFRDHIEPVRPETMETLKRVYSDYAVKQQQLVADGIAELVSFLYKGAEQEARLDDQEGKRPTSNDAADVSPSTDASEAPLRDEIAKAKTAAGR